MCGNFTQASPSVGILVRELSPLNQFVTFWLEIYPKDISSPLVIDQNVTYLMYSLERI